MPQPLHPALIIGLGGSGIEIVRRFRRRFTEQYEGTPYVRFFGIDTAPQEQPTADAPSLADEEFFWASRFDPAAYVGKHTIDDHREIKEWWHGYDGLPLQFVAAGAGQRRPVGRLAFFVHFDAIRQQLRQAIQGIYSSETYFALPDPYKHSLNVYVVASTCGGTGTGMFLDLATVVRHIALEVQPGKEVKVRGLLLLPSAFTGTGQVPHSVAGALRANAFGALTELDYAMSLSIRERKPVTYPGGLVARRDKPAFDSCYLVGNQSSSGAVYSKFDAILERAAIHMMIELASPLQALGESRLDNVVASIRATPDYRGRPRLYSSFAADWLELPSARVHVRWTKRYASRILQRLKQPYRGEGEQRMKTAFDGLSNQQAYGFLRRLMDRDGMKAYIPDVSDNEDALREIPPAGQPATVLVQRASALEAAYKRTLANVSVATGVESSLRGLAAEIEAAVGAVLGTGSLQDARALLERVRGELDAWSTQATGDRAKIDAGAWLTAFSTRVNELSPPLLEKLKSEKPGYVREQLAAVEDAISAARDAAVRTLRARVANALLSPDGLSSVRHRIEMLRDRVERAYAGVDGATVIIERQVEPTPPAGTETMAVTDQRADAAFEEAERLISMDQQAARLLAPLLAGNDPLAQDVLAQRVWDVAHSVVGESAAAYLASIPISPAAIGSRVNQLEPFALFTAMWSSTEGSRRTHRLDLIGVPAHLKEQEPAIKRAIEPARRSDPEIVEHADPDRIIMTGQLHGYPLFALAEVGECKQAHEATPALEQSLRFTLPEPDAHRWDLMPMSSDDAARWFSLAIALGHVRRDLQRYGFRRDGADTPVPFGEPADDPSLARRSARDAFVDSGYATLVAREVELRAAKEGNAWLQNALKGWLEDEEPKASQAGYPEEFRADIQRVRSFYNSIQFS